MWPSGGKLHFLGGQSGPGGIRVRPYGPAGGKLYVPRVSLGTSSPGGIEVPSGSTPAE